MFKKAEETKTYQAIMNIIKVSKKVFLETKQLTEENKEGLLIKTESKDDPLSQIGAGLAAHSTEFLKLQSFFAEKLPLLVMQFAGLKKERFDGEVKKNKKKQEPVKRLYQHMNTK